MTSNMCLQGQNYLVDVMRSLSSVVQDHNALEEPNLNWESVRRLQQSLETYGVLVCRFRLTAILRKAGCLVGTGLFSWAKLTASLDGMQIKVIEGEKNDYVEVTLSDGRSIVECLT